MIDNIIIFLTYFIPASIIYFFLHLLEYKKKKRG